MQVQIATPLADTIAKMPFCLLYTCSPDLVCEGDDPLPKRGGAIEVPVPPPGDTTCFSNGGFKCDIKMAYRASMIGSPDDDPQCGLGICGKLKVSVLKDCEPGGGGGGGGGPGGGGPGSIFDWGIETYRTNYGLADKTDDRLADLPFSSATGSAGIRRDRVMTSDTVEVKYIGWVPLGGGFNIFPIRIWTEMMQSDFGLNGTDKIDVQYGQSSFPNYEYGYTFLNSRCVVKYANGLTADFQPIFDKDWEREDQHFVEFVKINISPKEVVDALISENHSITLNLLDLFNAGKLPKPTLDMGDSLFWYTDFKVKANFAPLLSGTDDPPLLHFRNAVYWDDGEQYAGNKPWIKHRLMQYSGFREHFQHNTFGIKPCQNSIEILPFRYSIHLARPNLFPFEVRRLSHFLNYRHTAPGGLQLSSATLKYLVLQDSIPILSDLALPFSIVKDTLRLDLDTIYNPVLDEGYAFSTRLTWLKNCQFGVPIPSSQLMKIQYPPCFISDSFQIVERRLSNSIGFYANQAHLVATTAQPNLTLGTTHFDLHFLLKNDFVTAAPNGWVYFTDENGGLADLQLLQNGQPVPSVNGIFQLGTLAGLSEWTFEIKGKTKSCNPETLHIHYGWACDPPSTPDQSACGIGLLDIKLNLQNPELELAILNEPAQIPLCTASDFFEIEITNAKFGNAYDLLTSVKLPTGLSVASGSVEISYPLGSAWSPAADPTALAGNVFLWKINDLLPAIVADGLPGVTDAPKNKFKLRFRVLATCGFVAESQPIFGVKGIEPCGKTTNQLQKTGHPIHLAGLTPSYSAQLSVAPTTGQTLVSCGQTVPLSVQITFNSGQPTAGDSIVILLPSGVSFVVGSYSAGAGAPVGPPVFSGKMGRLPLPSGVSSLSFSISVKYESPADCLDKAIVVQVRSLASAICSTTGQPCGVSIANGEAIWFLPAENPEFALQNIVVEEITAGNWQLDATIENQSATGAAGATMQLFNDQNGNSQLDATDPFLGTFSTNASLAAGQIFHLTGPFAGNPPAFCNLLAVFNAAENCACTDHIFPFENEPTFIHLPLAVCDSQKPVEIGIAQSTGSTYEWILTDGSVSCSTCAQTNFTFPPNALPNQPISLILLEKTTTCTRRHQFEISFGTAFSLVVSDSTICRGSSVLISTQSISQGVFQWSSGQTTASIQVSPSQTAQFSVTVSLPSGCTSVASTTIAVLPSDSISLPKISICNGESVVVFGQNVHTAGVFCKEFQKSNGCDSLVCQPVALLGSPQTNQSATLCAGDTLHIFQNQTVTTAGNFCKTFTAANGCDSLHCISVSLLPKVVLPPLDTLIGVVGTSITINGPTGFADYEWSPPFLGCNGCASPEFSADSAGVFVVKLVVTDSKGCHAEQEIVLRFFPPCDPQSLKIPNAFTPNGDGLNDEFKPLAPEGSEVIERLTIYDRWGEKVAESSGPTASWDGKIKGKPAPLDVYVWVLEVRCFNGTTQRVGDVTVLR